MYGTFLFESLNSTYVLFASIDRILITSTNSRTRGYSTFRLAKICMISGSLFWIIFHIHALILSGIQELDPNYHICFLQSGIYLVLVGYYVLIKAIGPSIILIICGLKVLKNLRNIRRIRVFPSATATRVRIRGQQEIRFLRNRQLILMLIVDISIYVIVSIQAAGILMYYQITQYQTNDYQQIQFHSFLINIGTFIFNIQYCIGLYTKLFVSKSFRTERKKLFLCIKTFCFH